MKNLYDLSELREMSGDDEAFISEMIDLFIKNNTSYLEELNKAIAVQDYEQVKFFAHKIKPSILVMHIESQRKNILDLNEFAGKKINLERIPKLINELTEELNVVFEQLNDKNANEC